jgi:hypothetical protein
VDYGREQAVCPRCGSGAQVRTVAELFEMMNGTQDQAMQRAQQGQQQGPYGTGQPGQAGQPGQPGQAETYAGGYSESGAYGNRTGGRADYDNPFTDRGDDIAGAVMDTAFRFVGRAIGKRVQKTIEDRIVPAMQAKAAQAQQQWQQSKADQAAIVEKYPDLRACLHDKVLFLDAGSRVVPLSEIRPPVTMAQADIVVDKLRAP